MALTLGVGPQGAMVLIEDNERRGTGRRLIAGFSGLVGEQSFRSSVDKVTGRRNQLISGTARSEVQFLLG